MILLINFSNETKKNRILFWMLSWMHHLFSILPSFQISLSYISIFTKQRPHLKKISTRRNFFILFMFFLFSQEVLQNGRNVNKFPTFYKFFDILRHFLTENEKTEATFKIGIDKAKLWYFMTHIPKFHILATRGKKSWICICFGHKDFLNEKEQDE